jgi:hypothetical protein
VGEAIMDLGREAVEVVDASIKTLNDRINAARAGEYVIVEFERGVTNKRTGWIILAIGLAVAVGLFLLTGCISVRH